MEARLEKFLSAKKLSLEKKISKGYSSEVYLVASSKGERLALKIEKEKSPRQRMVEKEASNLRLANSLGIGPRLAGFDLGKRIILMEFIDGSTFRDWLFEQNPNKKTLSAFLRELFAQAKRLDEAGLDHGQLAGKGANILVHNGKPVIIDFEKASQQRKPHNLSQLDSMLFRNPHSAVAKKVRAFLALDSFPNIPLE
jgi:putative serine/threonine protein kinase